MILIGQYDSPFVRRVGIALTLYGMAFEHRPWSVFGDADLVRAYNPAMKVPVLVLAGGDVIIESHMMLDYLDQLMPEAARLFPMPEPERHRALKLASLGMALAEKAVSLFYEKVLHKEISETWANRCERQIRSVADTLEIAAPQTGSDLWLSGAGLGHADIAIGCAMRFLRDAHPGLLSDATHPKLCAFADRLEAMDVFKAISQDFVPPK